MLVIMLRARTDMRNAVLSAGIGLVCLFALQASDAAPLSNVVAITAGSYHTCVLTSSGGIKCWGANDSGQLGDGTTTNRSTPVDVTGLTSGVSAISAGGVHTCALMIGGGMKCWGNNAYGQLGDGTTTNRSAPVDVTGLAGNPLMIAGGDSHTCALMPGGGAKCWGYNGWGQLGNIGAGNSNQTTPIDVTNSGSAFASISGGIVNTCVTTTGGGAKCWGSNFYGESAYTFSNPQAASSPQDVVGLTSGVSRVMASGASTCAIMATGGAKCWGQIAEYSLGQFVNGSPAPPPPAPPRDVTGLGGNVVQMGAGIGFQCALGIDVRCWGNANGWGILGRATTTWGWTVPMIVTGLPVPIAAIAVASTHACALTTGGLVACWGANGTGQLGNGSANNGANPVPQFVGDFTAQQVSFGSLPSHFTTDPPFPVFATSSFGLTVGFSSFTPDVCTVSGTTVTLVASGVCTLAANQAGDSIYSPAQAVQSFMVKTTDALSPPRLGNISTRLQAGTQTGENLMIGGFIIGGTTPKTVAIVATGPSLSAYGIANPMPDPFLRLVRSSDQIIVANNDNWQDSGNAAELQATGFAPSDPNEAAILITLPPGAYTALLTDTAARNGVGVIAVYEIDRTDVPLINIATRGQVLAGDNVMIAGFIVQGSGPQNVAITATGPSLAAFGIVNPLANPTLKIVRSSDQSVIATNDDWQSDANASALQAAGFAPSNPLEAGLLLTLQPGAYTAIVSGSGGGTGVSVVGVYTTH
jgi:alpha-tubulin suppressor-like RCC1 family protein